MKARVCICAAISIAYLAAADQNAVVTQAVAKIVEQRDTTAEYVLDVKRKFKVDDPEYKQARDLYISANAKHNAWITTLKMAVQNGKTKNLGKDETYQKIAADADEAAKAFITYVQTLPGTKTRNLGMAAAVSLGMNLWKGISEKRQQERDEAAERLGREAKWRSWEEIVPPA